ncbi:MAG: methyltransferase domain-containing protein [Chitinophagaceae bacterium]
MTVKEHYENHLGNFYSWMTGNFDSKKQEFKKFFIDNGVIPQTNKIAIDLGAGHGLQSIPLAELGFQVLAVDFNQQLIDELKANSNELTITVKIDDIKNVSNFFTVKPDLIVCCGDTLSHLDNKSEIEKFITDISNSLEKNGKLILSFRDYSNELTGRNRFIPVKSDETKILTCILDYENDFVNVTDLLYEKTNDGWVQKISSYKKVRLITKEIIELLQKNNLKIEFNDIVNRLTTIIALKNT